MNRILELRKAKGLNQTELAKKLGIGQSTLSYWERGDYEPDNESIIKIADFFNITTDYLLGRSDNPSPPNPKEKAMPDLHGLDPEKDRAYFSAMADLKRQGLLPHDLQVIGEVYKAAKERDKKMKK